MPRIKTFYDELGVPRDANAAAIKHAFKEIAKVYHPDKNPDKQEWAHEQMSRFNFIVETLLNPTRVANTTISSRNTRRRRRNRRARAGALMNRTRSSVNTLRSPWRS